MNRTEDLLRAALSLTAEQIPAGSVPPLQLPAGAERPGGAHRAGVLRSHRKWLAAVAAAAAVALVVTVAAALAGGPQRVRQVGPLATMPTYYVAIQSLPGCSLCVITGGQPYYASVPDRAVIRSTVTGKTIAIVGVPKPYGSFTAVASAGDNRSFVLSAQDVERFGARPPTAFYLLRLNPAAGPDQRARLRALPVPPLRAGEQLQTMALSPDGSKLAIVYQHLPGAGPGELVVYDLASGAHRTWTMPATARLNNRLTWSADNRTLALLLVQPVRRYQLALLDTSRPSDRLRTDAAIWTLPRLTPGTVLAQVVLTADFRHVVEVQVVLPSQSVPPVTKLTVVTLATGAVTSLSRNAVGAGVVWTDQSGQDVVIRTGTDYAPAYALVTRGQKMSIVMPAGTLSVAW
jgi:hypothetical protein